MRSLDKAAKICGQTRQAFVTTAVMGEVAEALERDRLKRARLRPLTRESSFARDGSAVGPSEQPQGFLADALRARRREEEPVTALAPAQQAPVIVNVGTGSASSPSSDVDRLAAYIVAGDNDLERDGRQRRVVEILRESTQSPEERKVLAARLDEAVAKLKKTPPPAADPGGEGVGRVARIAYDKLVGLWRG